MKLLKLKKTWVLALVMLFSLGFSYAVSSSFQFDNQLQLSSKETASVDFTDRLHFSDNLPDSDLRSPIENKIENNEDESKDDHQDSYNFKLEKLNCCEKYTSELNGVKLKHANCESDNIKSVSVPKYILFLSWKISLV